MVTANVVAELLSLGSDVRLSLKGFSLGSEAEVLDDDAGEEGEGVEVGFSFGDGYDEVAAACEGAIDHSLSHEAVAVVAVETNVVEVIGEGCVTGVEHQSAGVCIIVDLCSPIGGSAPVPDGQVGAGRPGVDAAEAERADEVGKVDDGVLAQGEEADILVEVSADGHATAIEVDICAVADGVCGGDEERAAGDIDDCAVAHGSGCGGLEGAAGDGGVAGEAAVVAGEDLGAGFVFYEGSTTGDAAGVGGVAARGADCEVIRAEGDI